MIGNGSKKEDNPTAAAPYRFYAVFDGHGGDFSAHYAGKHLPVHLSTMVKDGCGIQEAMFDACRLTDRNLIQEVDRQFVRDEIGENLHSFATLFCHTLLPLFSSTYII